MYMYRFPCSIRTDLHVWVVWMDEMSLERDWATHTRPAANTTLLAYLDGEGSFWGEVKISVELLFVPKSWIRGRYGTTMLHVLQSFTRPCRPR
jgi:hypothetical protein